MSVRPAGPRLFSSIPFHHLAQVGHGGGKGLNVPLNVTPFVDMMTILVTFLLMTFSTTGELISATQGLVLPNATQKDALKIAPIVLITSEDVIFDNKPMIKNEQILSDSAMDIKIPELYDELRKVKSAFMHPQNGGYEKLSAKEKSNCTNPKENPSPDEICLVGLLILQADRDTPAKVLNKVIKTANLAEYPNIMFAVNMKDAKAQ